MLEEKDLLQRSNKNLKNVITDDLANQCTIHVIPSMPAGNPRQPLSYKESLVGLIPRAYQKAFFEKFGMDQGKPMKPLEEYKLKVNLSVEAKSKIRQKWTTSLIIKVFDKIVGFNYLKWKIHDLWKYIGRMDIIDLGDGYFITKFTFEKDIQSILRGGSGS